MLSLLIFSIIFHFGTSANVADVANYPYLVKVGYPTYYWCSGAIISEKFVLTNYLYCASDRYPKGLFVKYLVGDEVKEALVKNIYSDPKLDRGNQDFNVGILELEEPLTLGTQQPIALADASFVVPEGTELIAAGWADTIPANTNDELEVFTSIDLTAVSNADCKARYIYGVPDSTVCASCSQNSRCLYGFGSALVTPDNILVGLFLKQDIDMWNNMRPAQYGRISSEREFIAQITGL